MTVALGASAYSAAVFHLMTHAFFKALLFLAAGSVIIGMHHDQDIRNMGGLRKYMKVTWITSLLGSLALIGFPFFSGFYSKDSIIEAVQESHRWGSGYAYFCVIAGVFVTAFYSFRMYFLVFHGEERFGKAHNRHDAHVAPAHDDGHSMAAYTDGDHEHEASAAHAEEESDEHHHGLAPGEKPHESPWVVTLPLVLLAIPSVLIGFFTIQPMLYGDWFKGAVTVLEQHDVLGEMGHKFQGAASMGLHLGLPFILAMAGVALSWFFYLKRPDIPAAIQRRFSGLYVLLDNKYYFDRFNEIVFAGGARMLGRIFWKAGDQTLIDGLAVNGTAGLVGGISQLTRALQSGFVYHYAFWIISGVAVLLVWMFPVSLLGKILNWLV
jgi:NADH-quinone oxidoreductase subunit L